MSGNLPVSPRFIKKVTNSRSRINDLYRYFLPAANYLRKLYLNNFIISKISKNQSGFRPGDSTVNQLVDLANEI